MLCVFYILSLYCLNANESCICWHVTSKCELIVLSDSGGSMGFEKWMGRVVRPRYVYVSDRATIICICYVHACMYGKIFVRRMVKTKKGKRVFIYKYYYLFHHIL